MRLFSNSFRPRIPSQRQRCGHPQCDAQPTLAAYPMTAYLNPAQRLTLQQQILEMLATDQDLVVILLAILQGIETDLPQIKSAIYPLAPQNNCFEMGISNTVPLALLSQMQAESLTKSTSWLTDIANQVVPTPKEFVRVLPHHAHERCAVQNHLANVWGTALLNSQGQPLGVLALYSAHPQPYPLTWAQQQILEVGTHLASIAMEYKHAKAATQQAEDKYQDIVEHLTIGIFQTTPEGRYISANPALAKLYGYDSPAELIDALTNIGDQLYIDPQRRSEFVTLLQEYGTVSKFESQVRCRDGRVIWISENTRSVCDAQSNVLYYEGTVEDVTARRIAEEKLLHGALHDALTQLPNRTCFLHRVQQIIDLHQSPDPPQPSQVKYAVLFIDLDRFKVINDSLGHLVGDELLRAVAQRLSSHLAPTHLFARMGGDEFALLLTDIENVQAAVAIAEQLLHQLHYPFQLQQYEVFVGASIGIAWGQSLYTTAEAIVRDADIAMYRAKHNGHQHYQVFDPQMQEQAHQRLQLEHDLRYAIERQELVLVYQPLVDLHTRQLRGFEVLLRWNHAERGAIAPDLFIPLAEETGQIHPIGDWVLEQACLQLQQWQPLGVDVYVNVNLSMLQLRDKHFVPRLQQLCRQYQIAPSALKLELTESCLLDDDAIHGDRLQDLKSMGFSLCVDDFGTGYSSLSRLHTLPIDTLKIDRSFVENLGKQEHTLPLIKTIVALANSLELAVVAEGVETAQQANLLATLGCHTAQGYLYAQPLDALTARAWLEQYLKTRSPVPGE